MALISIQHEGFGFYEDKVDSYEEFLKLHTSNVEKFRKIVKEVLHDEEGKYIFDYITKYHQFDFVEGTNNLTEEQINAIENEYPNCFV